MSGAKLDRAEAKRLIANTSPSLGGTAMALASALQSALAEIDRLTLEASHEHDCAHSLVGDVDRLTADREARAAKLRAAFETDDPDQIVATMEMVIADRDKLQGERDRMRVAVDAAEAWASTVRKRAMHAPPGDPDLHAPPDVRAAMRTRLLAAVDAAYPFGIRKHQPYKDWLTERKLLHEALADVGKVALPTKDEIDACEVARDMVEEGRLDDARAVLEQAPNRLARKCPACGAAIGSPCGESRPAPRPHASPFDGIDRGVTMLVPHHARLVGHLDAVPRFGEDGR